MKTEQKYMSICQLLFLLLFFCQQRPMQSKMMMRIIFIAFLQEMCPMSPFQIVPYEKDKMVSVANQDFSSFEKSHHWWWVSYSQQTSGIGNPVQSHENSSHEGKAV